MLTTLFLTMILFQRYHFHWKWYVIGVFVWMADSFFLDYRLNNANEYLESKVDEIENLLNSRS